MEATNAPSTNKAYRGAWQKFETWCREWRRCDAFPAPPDAVREYIAWATQLRTPRYKAKTIHLAVVGINRKHKDAGLPPAIDNSGRAVLAGVMREAARAQRPEEAGKRHLTVEQLKTICGSLGSSAIDVRDRALFTLGFATALRRSDLCRLTAATTHFEDGRLRFWIPVSKTDQLGKGRYLVIHPAKDESVCPVRALKAWRDLRVEFFGNFSGPLFLRFRFSELTDQPLRPQAVCDAVQRRLLKIGVKDALDYGAHSMRSGMITAADAAGATLRAIMDRSGHRSVAMVMRYIKSTRGVDPLAGVL